MADASTALLQAIGVMSGTSMDAIDVAMLTSDGETVLRIGPSASYTYPPFTRTALLDLIADPARIERDDLTVLERAVTDAHCLAVENFLRDNAIAADTVDLVGFHGQTILHRPDRRWTCQLLDGAYAAQRLGLDVVNRFRHRDVEAGGQGAPLAPLYHRARAHHLQKPLAILNLGGVANVTMLYDDHILAFDTGPASALMDDVMRKRGGADFDRNGRHAQAGQIHTALLQEFLADPYFEKKPPKSLDRNDFHRWMKSVDELDLDDALATLAAFTVESIAKARDYCAVHPLRWLVGGGGRRNAHVMQALATRLQVPVEPVEAAGWDGDMLEAECFAWLAIRTVKSLPLSLPSTTGVPAPLTGGTYHPAKRSERS